MQISYVIIFIPQKSVKNQNKLFKKENEFFKTENAVIKKEIALREQKATARLKAKKQPSSRNSEPKDID